MRSLDDGQPEVLDSQNTQLPESFVTRLMLEMGELEDRYQDLMDRSDIRNVDPNRGGSSVVFIAASKWGWVPNQELTKARTRLAADLDEWFALFNLLHRTALPETEKRVEASTALLRRWVVRQGRDRSIPATVDKARDRIAEAFEELRALIDLAAAGSPELLAVPDTNALLQCPDVAAYRRVLHAAQFEVVLLPTVLSELDDLKDRGRSAEIREAAGAVVRRIKGLRDRGDFRQGVPVEGKISLRAEHREVQPHRILEWLDPSVADDRIVGAVLDLQARHPRATVVLITRDINLQNKAAAVGLPFSDPAS